MKNPIALTADFDSDVYIPQVPALGFANSNIGFDHFTTAQPVRVASSGGGLTAGTVYYARRLGSAQISLYDSAANARNTRSVAGRMDLTSSIVSRLVKVNPDGTDGESYKPVSTNNTNETLSFDPDYETGTSVQVTSDTGGVLKSGIDYFLRKLSSGKYAFYATEANAVADTARINLTAEVAPTDYS